MMSNSIQKTIKKAVAQRTSRARLAARALGTLALAVLGISQAYANTIICNYPPPIYLTIPPLVFDGGADGPVINQPIGSNWGVTVSYPNYFSGDADCMIREVWVLKTPSTTNAGTTYTENGVTYPVYNTVIPNIGFIMGVKQTSAANYTPITNTTVNIIPLAPIPSPGMGIDIQLKLIVLGSLTSGVYEQHPMLLFLPYGVGVNPNTGTSTSDVLLDPFTVTVRARTCQMVGATVQNVPLPPVSKNQFSGVGSSAGAGYHFSLSTLCDSGVNLYATMTDANDPSNTGNTLSLGTGSTVSGVGVQILRNNQAIAFGPDSAAAGNTNQWYIDTTGGGGKEVVSIPLEAKYVQTASNMVAGSIRSNATVTFSYQ